MAHPFELKSWLHPHQKYQQDQDSINGTSERAGGSPAKEADGNSAKEAPAEPPKGASQINGSPFCHLTKCCLCQNSNSIVTHQLYLSLDIRVIIHYGPTYLKHDLDLISLCQDPSTVLSLTGYAIIPGDPPKAPAAFGRFTLLSTNQPDIFPVATAPSSTSIVDQSSFSLPMANAPTSYCRLFGFDNQVSLLETMSTSYFLHVEKE